MKLCYDNYEHWTIAQDNIVTTAKLEDSNKMIQYNMQRKDIKRIVGHIKRIMLVAIYVRLLIIMIIINFIETRLQDTIGK